ncbi:unnamed protein product, partial [Didymodactylos carnosus]
NMKIRQTYGSQFIDGIYNCWPKFSSLWEPPDKALIDDKLLIVTLLTKTFIIHSKSNNFPMYCKEFKEGTQDYYEFHMSIKKITAGLELSSFLIFELLVLMLCREKQNSFEDEILNSISHFVLNTKDDSQQIEIFQYI